MLRALLSIGLLLCVAAPGLAGTPVLFVSPLDDGVNPGAPPILSGSPTESLYLYLEAGASATGVGTACDDGDGDELCQWEFALQLIGDASVSTFVPDPGQDVVWSSTAGALDATGGKSTVGELGPIRIGELQLAISGTSWTADVVAGSAVDASFALDSLSTGTIALPEPGATTQLLAGCAALFWLARRRASR